MTPQQFRKEIESVFPSTEFYYDNFCAQTYPVDPSNIGISWDTQTGYWVFSGKNGAIGHGKTLKAAIANVVTTYGAWVDSLSKQNALTVTA